MPRRADDRLVVVRHQPGFRRRWWLTIIAVALSGLAAGYWLAHLGVGYRHASLQEQLSRLSQEYRELQQSESALRQQVATLESGRAIDDLARQEIKATIHNLEEVIAKLRQDVSFYRSIMLPSDNARGLQIQNVTLKSLPEPRRVQYKFVLAQLSDAKDTLSGVMAVNLIGQRGEAQEVIPLRDVSEVKELGIKFEFKYFQEFAGELLLPEDFVPERLQVVAQSKGRSASRVERSFDWQDLIAKQS